MIDLSAEVGNGSMGGNSTKGRVHEKGDQHENTAVNKVAMTPIKMFDIPRTFA